MNKSDMAVAGARAALVDNRQKGILIMAAKDAFAAQVRCGMENDDVDFDEWRKGVCWDICQKSSFRDLNQKDYGLVLGELRSLQGHDANTLRQKRNERVAHSEENGDGDRRRALYMLRGACKTHADVFGGYDGACRYAAAILNKTHKLPVGSEWRLAHAKQLTQTMFTLNSRARAKAKKSRGASATPELGFCDHGVVAKESVKEKAGKREDAL